MTRRLIRTRETWLVLAAATLSAGHLWLVGYIRLGPVSSLLVLEWCLTATFGICYSAAFVHDLLVDDYVRGLSGQNGTLRETVDILLIAACVLLIVHIMFLGLGLPNLLTPAPAPRATSVSQIYGIAYVVVGQLLVYGLSLINRKRRRLLPAR